MNFPLSPESLAASISYVGTTPPLMLDFDMRPRFGKAPPGPSADLFRIRDLPRRDLEKKWSAADIDALEAQLRREPATNAARGWVCECAKQGRVCPLHLRKLQAYSLLEARENNGFLGGIGVGNGKTLNDLLLPMVVPNCRMAVLFIQANLRVQLLERDIPYYGAHWRIPYVVDRSGIADLHDKTLPRLHIITYDKLSRPDGTDLLRRIKPDLIICDESQNLKHQTGRGRASSRSGRFMRYLEENPETRLCAQSGSMVVRGIKDAWHLGALALKNGSPFPMTPATADSWASALDPATAQGGLMAPPGALSLFVGHPTEDTDEARAGWGKRWKETPGCVNRGADEDIASRLEISVVRPVVPEPIRHAISEAHGGTRPDGEQFNEILQALACARQLAAGFYHRWRYPRGRVLDAKGRPLDAPADVDQRADVIKVWFARRKAWNKALYDELKHPTERLDSPFLLENAARRANAVPRYKGDLPLWDHPAFLPWEEIRGQVDPEPEPVWMDEFLVNYAADWARNNVGIVWVEFPELGHRISKVAGVPYYGEGAQASSEIAAEKGDRTIIASIRSHGVGKNLQVFNKNLFTTGFINGDQAEQALGRTYRDGQTADVVTNELCVHTPDLEKSLAKAREEARFAEKVNDGNPQRLNFATWVLK